VSSIVQLAVFDSPLVEPLTTKGRVPTGSAPAHVSPLALHLPDGPDRIRYQTDSILQSFRLRELGWPVTVQLTGAVYLFRDEVRVAQTSAATLAVMSKANLVRSHEVSRVQPVLNLQDYA